MTVNNLSTTRSKYETPLMLPGCLAGEFVALDYSQLHESEQDEHQPHTNDSPNRQQTLVHTFSSAHLHHLPRLRRRQP
jgi:hypothetical protein